MIMSNWNMTISMFISTIIIILLFRRTKLLTDFWISNIATGVVLLLLILFLLSTTATRVYPLLGRWADQSPIDLIIYILNHEDTYLLIATFAGFASLFHILDENRKKFKKNMLFKKRSEYRKRQKNFQDEYRYRGKIIKLQNKKIKKLEQIIKNNK